MEERKLIKILEKLRVFSKKEIKGKVKTRVNPYNPLSYLSLLILYPVVIIIISYNAVKRELVWGNPFKWG